MGTVSVAPRAVWTTALITLFGGPVAGFLWIGQGLAAVICLVATAAATAALLYFGFPVFASPSVNEVLATYSSVLWQGLAVLLVVPFAARSMPDKWYARGISVSLLFVVSSLGVLGVRTFLLQPMSMASMSMAPTIEAGDYLIVTKNAYGYRLPSWGAASGNPWLPEAPKRGDVVVLSAPDVGAVVNRVVGLPGETVQMLNGVLHIDGAPVQLEADGTYENMEMLSVPIERQRETLRNGAAYSVLNMQHGLLDDTELVQVPAGHYFMLGDNRDLSADSRSMLGFVATEALIGRVDRVFWNGAGNDYSGRQKVSAER